MATIATVESTDPCVGRPPRRPMTEPQPSALRLPTPGCYADPDRSGLTADDVFDGMTEHLFYTLGKLAPAASRHDLYMALSYAVRDRLMTRYLAGIEAIAAAPPGWWPTSRPNSWWGRSWATTC